MKKFFVIVLSIIVVITAIKMCLYRTFDVDTQSLFEYCKQNGYSQEYCIFVDFSKPQGVNRFCIYDFKQGKIVAKSLCAQGRGRENNIFNHTFSNEIGSYYSSLGKYRVGDLVKMSKTIMGHGYLMYGLESTNSNARERAIMIHRGNVGFETFPLPCIPMSKGCFAVSNKMMKAIAEVESKTDKPILLYAYK
jgi:hypothetical protein